MGREGVFVHICAGQQHWMTARRPKQAQRQASYQSYLLLMVERLQSVMSTARHQQRCSLAVLTKGGRAAG